MKLRWGALVLCLLAAGCMVCLPGDPRSVEQVVVCFDDDLVVIEQRVSIVGKSVWLGMSQQDVAALFSERRMLSRPRTGYLVGVPEEERSRTVETIVRFEGLEYLFDFNPDKRLIGVSRRGKDGKQAEKLLGQ